MNINVTLPKSTITRLGLLLFFQNKGLYIYLVASGVVTAYTLSTGNYGLLIVAWLPYLFYVFLGIFNILRQTRRDDNPQLLPARYTLSGSGITVKTKLGENKFGWDEFKGWQVVAENFVLLHSEGFIFAIPKKDIPTEKLAKFQRYLKEYIPR